MLYKLFFYVFMPYSNNENCNGLEKNTFFLYTKYNFCLDLDMKYDPDTFTEFLIQDPCSGRWFVSMNWRRHLGWRADTDLPGNRIARGWFAVCLWRWTGCHPFTVSQSASKLDFQTFKFSFKQKACSLILFSELRFSTSIALKDYTKIWICKCIWRSSVPSFS